MSTVSDIPARNTTPNGCVVGLAEEIAQAIADQEYGTKKNKLAVRIWSSFKQAGWQTGPEAGLRYFFDTPKLCEDLKTTPRSLANMRREMEQDGLFAYHPNLASVGSGWCIWNPNYKAWRRHSAGGARPGAGNPAWKAAASQSPLESKDEQLPVSHLLKAEHSIQTVTTRLVETHSSGDNLPAVTPFKRCQLARSRAVPQQVAIDEPKKGTEEETKEETYIAPTASPLPAVDRTADAAQEDGDGIALRIRREEWRELVNKIRHMEKNGLVGAYLRNLREQERRLRAALNIDTAPPVSLLPSSHSHAPEGDTPASDQQEAPPGAWLSENEQVTIATRTPDAPEDETPPASLLFEEAAPPPKVDLFRIVGGWFFDLEHISKRDAQSVQEVVNRLKARGLTDEYDLRTRYEHWCDKFKERKQKSIFHFESKVAWV